MAETDPAYIAVEPCGCVTAVTVATPEFAKENAKEVAKWIRGGRTVEHTTVADARARFTAVWPCEHVSKAGAGMVA